MVVDPLQQVLNAALLSACVCVCLFVASAWIYLCAAACTGSPTANGATFSCGATSSFGSVCVGTCNAGFVGTINATCTGTAWAVSGACTRTCTGNPSNPTNGRFTCPVTSAGQTCTAQCDANVGFVPSAPGMPSAMCLSNGAWTVPTGSCVRGCIGMPTAPANAVWSCPTVTAVGQTCNGTRDSAGSLFATCQADFTWATGGVLSTNVTS